MGINIPPEALEAAARAMAKAGYGFTGIELTDPYTADAEYWDTVARAACLAMLKAWPGMHTHEWHRPWLSGMSGTDIILPLTENTNDKA